MNIVERIFYLLGVNGKSATELGEFIGVKPSSITGWKKGSFPSSKYIQKIAEFFGVSVSYLILGHEEELGNPKSNDIPFYDEKFLSMYAKLNEKDKYKIEGMIEIKLQEQKQEQEKANAAAQSKIVPLPYENTVEETSSEYLYEVPYRGQIAAGTPLHHFSDLFDEEAPLVPCEFSAQYAWKISGHSMEPLIKDGDMIFTKPVEKHNLNDGDVVVIRTTDGYNCKRIYHYPEKELVVLKSENPDKETYPDQEYYYGDGIDTLQQIEGKVIL